MCVVAPGQDDAPNDEMAMANGNGEGVGDSNVVGNGTVLIFLKKKHFFRGAQVQGGQSEPG